MNLAKRCGSRLCLREAAWVASRSDQFGCEASLHDELVTNSDPVYQIEIELVLECDLIMCVERTKYELSI